MSIDDRALLAQISDLHIQVGAGDRTPTARAEAVIAAVAALVPAPDSVLVTGDLVHHGAPAEYDRVRELLAPLRMPVHVLPGNHDDRDALRATLGAHAGDSRGSFVQYTDPQRPRCGWWCATPPSRAGTAAACATSAWPSSMRRSPPIATRRRVLAMHHPPLLTGIRVMDEIGLDDASRAALCGPARAGAERAPHRRRARAPGHVRRLGGCPVFTCPSTDLAIQLDLAGSTRDRRGRRAARVRPASRRRRRADHARPTRRLNDDGAGAPKDAGPAAPLDQAVTGSSSASPDPLGRLRRPSAAAAAPRRTRPATTPEPTHSAGRIPSVNRLGRPVAALVGEDRRQHRDSEHAAQLADGVVRPRRLARFDQPHRAHDQGRDRGEEEPHADPRQRERRDDLGVGHGRREHRRHPRRARSPATRARPRGTACRRCGRSAPPRSGRRSSASPSTAACECPPAAASSPARSGGTGSAGRSSRTCRRTSAATRRSRPRTCGS